ncbi:MAG: LysR family transcriptional regulator [Firmicutes bacterium]|nr:LysR family transcriptional regulator [Bacillota bacterium]
MDVRLRIFLAVAYLRQLTKASRYLHLAPSSVSEQLSSLEHDLGTVLFTRSHRGMELTLAGDQLYRAAQRIEGEWNAVLRDFERMAKGMSQIRLAASQTATELYLPNALGRFRRQFPDAPLHVLMVNSRTVMEEVAAGRVDLGLVEGGGIPSTLVSTPLWRDHLALIVADQHRLAGQEVVPLDELFELDWILREAGSGTRAIFEQALAVAGFPEDGLKIIMELSSLRAILAMVANNVGVSVLSLAIVDAQPITVHGICALPIAAMNLSRSIQLVTRAERQPNSLLDGLVEVLVQDAEIYNRRHAET